MCENNISSYCLNLQHHKTVTNWFNCVFFYPLQIISGQLMITLSNIEKKSNRKMNEYEPLMSEAAEV